MREKIPELWKKYRPVILYVFFGGVTTLVNMGCYALCYEVIGIPNVISTEVAWFFAVVVAYLTNKVWVFDSKSFSRETLLHEILTFFGARIATGLLDLLIMYLAVDVMHWNATIWKMISNVIVIILNYIASKLIIFKKRENAE